MTRLRLLSLALLVLLAGTVHGATRLSHQGVVSDSGTPLAGDYMFTFRIYADSTGGSLLWSESQMLTLQLGRFHSWLGAATPLPSSVFTVQTLWVETEVNTTVLSRQRLDAAHAAVFADSSRVAGSSSAGDGLWSTDGTNVWRSSGNVGIGIGTPNYKLHVESTEAGQAGYFQANGSIGTNYGVDASALGVGATTNIGGHFGARGAADNHAIIVPPGFGNVGVGTTSPASNHLLTVRTSGPGTAAFIRVDATSGTNYGIDAEAIGVAETNIGGYFAADGATNNYAIIVPPGYGNVGIGTTQPMSTLHVVGDLCVTGQKNALVPTSQGLTKVYSEESAEVWFTDYGKNRLVGGLCHIDLDPLFIETVTISDQHPLMVFLQEEDDCNGLVVTTGLTGFKVRERGRGTSNAHFSYRVVAKRKGYENARLEIVESATASVVAPVKE